MTNRARLIFCCLCILISACLLIYYGSMEWLKVKEVKIKFKNLPDRLNGLRILHITDLHANSETRKNLDIWKAASGLTFDFVVITGDMTVNKFSYLAPHLDDLKALAEQKPVYFVDGNHDRFYYGELTTLLEEYGVVTLANESVSLYDGALTLTGYRDFAHLQRNGKLGIANEMPSSDSFTLALYHQPQFFDYIDNKPDLSLCGHTHGGQIRLPFFPTLYAPGQGIFPKYGDGLYDFDGKKIYISRGIGTTVFPIRFFNRPELAVIELLKE